MPLKVIVNVNKKLRNVSKCMSDNIESTRLLAKIRLKTFQIRKESSINI